LKTLLEESDIQLITEKILESLRPALNKQKQSPDDSMLNVKDLCDYLRVSKSWIYSRTRVNGIPFYKIDGQILFRKADIDKFLQDYHFPAITERQKS